MNEIELPHVLLVEDSPDDLELTMSALRKANLPGDLHVARDGEEALDFVFGEGKHAGAGRLDEPPAVILLDLKLPKIDGLEVLQRLKSDARTKSIPVVVLTSSKEHGDVAESYRLGANSYVVKPVNFERFEEAVKGLGLYWLRVNQAPARMQS